MDDEGRKEEGEMGTEMEMAEERKICNFFSAKGQTGRNVGERS